MTAVRHVKVSRATQWWRCTRLRECWQRLLQAAYFKMQRAERFSSKLLPLQWALLFLARLSSSGNLTESESQSPSEMNVCTVTWTPRALTAVWRHICSLEVTCGSDTRGVRGASRGQRRVIPCWSGLNWVAHGSRMFHLCDANVISCSPSTLHICIFCPAVWTPSCRLRLEDSSLMLPSVQ